MFDFLKTYIYKFFKRYPPKEKRPPEHLYIPLLTSSYKPSIKLFFALFCDIDPDIKSQYHVKRLIWYKELSHSKLEFIVAELSHSCALLIERRPARDAASKAILSISSPSLSDRTVSAHDTVQGISRSSLTTRLESSPAAQVYQYTFRRFPSLEFTRLVAVISEQRPNYVINTTMCWFASTIVSIAKLEFGDGGSEQTMSSQAGSWNGWRYHVDVAKTEALRKIYVEKREADPDPLGPRGTELRTIKQNAERHAERAERHAERAERHAERAERHAERAERHAERAERHAERAERNVERAEHAQRTVQELQQENEELRRALEKGSDREGQ